MFAPLKFDLVYLIQIVDINSQTKWQIVQKKATDLDLHCLQEQGISAFYFTQQNTVDGVVSWHDIKISIMKDGKCIYIFCWKNVSYFHFCSKKEKISMYLKIFNEFDIYKLFKLRMLCTTRPIMQCLGINCEFIRRNLGFWQNAQTLFMY